MLNKILEYYSEESFVIADGFDEAIIGLDESTNRLIYSVDKCLTVLQERDGMELEDALEYFEFNVRGSYMGEQTPIWCQDSF